MLSIVLLVGVEVDFSSYLFAHMMYYYPHWVVPCDLVEVVAILVVIGC